ncbi:unnamed protein product [Sphagnum troendelagicum]
MGPAQRPRRFSPCQTQKPAGLASFRISWRPAVPTLVEWVGVRDQPVSVGSRSRQNRISSAGSPELASNVAKTRGRFMKGQSVKKNRRFLIFPSF